MKKIIIPVISAAFMIAGCKGGATKDADGKIGVSSEADANNIIGYTNDALEVLKSYNNFAGDKVKYYDELEKAWSQKESYNGFDGIDNLWTVKKEADHVFNSIPDALGDEKKFFTDSIGKYRSLYRQFSSQDSTLELYIKAEDFKDDNYSKGKDLINKQFEIYPQLVSLRESIDAKIETVADAAEEVALKNSPIKDEYKFAKTDLATFKKVANMIVDNEKYTDADLASIDSAYNSLAASIAKNAAVDKTNLTKESKLDSYNDLYKKLNEQSLILKSVIRDIKETKKLTDSDNTTVTNAYNSAISSYNSWVN